MSRAVSPLPPLERIALASIAGAVLGLVVHVGLRGLGAAAPAAVGGAIAGGAIVIALLVPRLPRELDGFLARRPVASTVWLFLALLALGQTARNADTMLESRATRLARGPRHSCLTASTEAVRFWRAGEPNIYRSELYLGRTIEGFHVDPYFYSPPYLLVPMGLLAITGEDFGRARAVWFALGALALLLAYGAFAAAADPATRLRAIALAPAVWASVPVELGLRMSNPHALVTGLAMGAWVAFARRPALGGALLAVASTIKLFPALVLADLAVRRRGRAVAWSIAALAALSVAGLVVVGPAAFREFLVYQLPRLSSGEACAREFASPFAVARNYSPLGLPARLDLLGVPGMTLALGQVVAKVYALGILALTLVSAHRVRHAAVSRTEHLMRGLAILALGSLSGPYAAADYSSLAVVWLLAVDRRLVGPWVAGAIALLTFVPFVLARATPAWIHAAAHTPMQAIAVVVPVLVLLRRPPADSPALPAAAAT